MAQPGNGIDASNRTAPGLDAALVAVLAGLLASRTLVAWTPLVHFDIDPSVVSSEAVIPFAGFGPCGSLMLDAMTTAVSAAVLWRLRRVSMAWSTGVLLSAALLMGIDLVAVLRSDFENLWRGSAWFAAFIGAGALAACGAHPAAAALRRVALGVLLGVGAIWLVKGALQLAIEHAQTVSEFHATKDAFFAAQGWDPGSPQALTYERRVLQLESTGWFGLSNIMAGLCAAVAVGVAGVAWIARGRCGRLGVGALCVLALGTAAIVCINGSKGAIAAMAIGVGAALIAHRSTWHARLALLVAMAIPVVVIVARGAVGESLGERSLLFRSQYWDGAWRVAIEAWPWGTGPDAFQAAYTRLRPWTAVEEVTSAHAAPVDWFATLGLAGLAVTLGWTALLLRAGGREREDASSGDTPESNSGDLREEWMSSCIGLVASVVVCATADPPGRLVALGALPLAAWIARAIIDGLRTAGRAVLRMTLVGTVAVLACHAMVDMTLWQPGSASWVLGILGACAIGWSCGPETTSGGASPSRAWFASGIIVLVLGASIGQGMLAVSVHAQERAVEAAAETIIENHGTAPARAKAAEQLAQAFDDHPWLRRHLLLAKSADQWLQAGLMETDPARARVWFDEALAHAARCQEAMPLRTALLIGSTAQAMAERGLVPWGVVIDAGQRVLDQDPRNLTWLVRIAQAHASAGDPVAAAAWAARALNADASFALDPLRQLPPATRAQCEALERE